MGLPKESHACESYPFKIEYKRQPTMMSYNAVYLEFSKARPLIRYPTRDY